MNPAWAADWILHAAAGGLLGLYLSAALAFVVGFATHWLLDLYVIEFMPFPVSKYWWWLVVQVVVVGGLVLVSPVSVVAGILGAILPDIIDGTQALLRKPGGGFNQPSVNIDQWLKNSRWQRGMMLFPFHRKGSKGANEMLELEVNALISLVSAVVLLVARRGGRE